MAHAQNALFPGAPKQKYPPERASLAAFTKFHQAHPEVYKLLLEKARGMKAVGFKKYSIKTLWEVLRWNLHLAQGSDTYKLNNNHHAFYARLLMHREPDLKGFFDLRERKKK